MTNVLVCPQPNILFESVEYSQTKNFLSEVTMPGNFYQKQYKNLTRNIKYSEISFYQNGEIKLFFFFSCHNVCGFIMFFLKQSKIKKISSINFQNPRACYRLWKDYIHASPGPSQHGRCLCCREKCLIETNDSL